MSPSFTALLDRVSARYDVVIIDTPPILAVTDAAVIGVQCGCTLMVVRAESNSIREIDHAANRLHHAGVNLRGCVLNGMTRVSRGHEFYHYSYG